MRARGSSGERPSRAIASSVDYGRDSHGDASAARHRASDRRGPWFGDRDAQRRRERIFGGEARRATSGRTNASRKTSTIELADDPYVDASDIEVSVSGGEVDLSGTVEDRQSRRRAEDLAEQVSGVSHVQNGIRVRVVGRTTSQDSGATTPADSPLAPCAGPEPAPRERHWPLRSRRT